ncbi:hypothetical protein HPB52_015584 [Rhipicephalus sanguineus]|uniref:Uncharacterized protein n=1 Tax=Rhipicephalus sanguineus TaxID=34632 RepID=A0A9D4SZ63_RHISA|nr:hypothetical protein HPB52_015584 [Rhipicephalus sanguineus]
MEVDSTNKALAISRDGGDGYPGYPATRLAARAAAMYERRELWLAEQLRKAQAVPVQCLEGTAEAIARSGANLVLCLPDESLSLEVGASVQEVPGWTWVQDPTSAAAAVAAASGDATALVRASAPIVVSGTPTLATAPGGEMLLVMDSSPVEDSVGLAAKSWFNDSVIATQALLTLEGHK